MSKFGGEKRYADILTVLLVIVIIGILGLLGYFGYTAFQEHFIENEAADAVQEFYDTLNNTTSEDEDEQNIEMATLDDFNTSTNTSSNGTSTSGRTKTYLDNYEVKPN